MTLRRAGRQSGDGAELLRSESISDTVRPARRRPAWAAVITIIVAAGFLYLAFRKIVWRDLRDTVIHARLWTLALSVIISNVIYFLRSLRWRVLLSAEKKVAPLTVFWATMVGYLGNNFLPARAGEVIRSVALGRRVGMSKSWVFATALTERLLDAVALVLCSLAAVFLLGRSSQWLVRAWKAMGVVGVAGIIILFAVPRFERLFKRILGRVPGPARFRERLLGILAQFLSGMRAFANASRGLAFAGMTVLIWLAEAVGTMIAARAFGLSLTLPIAVMLLAGSGSRAPSLPLRAMSGSISLLRWPCSCRWAIREAAYWPTSSWRRRSAT